MKTRPFATRLPSDLYQALDVVCLKLGLRKNFLVEAALREKIEDLMDAEDLRQALCDATVFDPWEQVKPKVRRGQRR